MFTLKVTCSQFLFRENLGQANCYKWSVILLLKEGGGRLIILYHLPSAYQLAGCHALPLNSMKVLKPEGAV